MKNIFLLVIFLLALSFISCSNSTEITWQGNWMSEKNYDERGTFTFDLRIEHEELTGTITIPGMEISGLQVEGEIIEDTLFLGVNHIEFSDRDNRMTFEAVVISDIIDSDTRTDGFYTDNATGDLGIWYCKDNSRKDFSDISSFPLDSSILNTRGLCFDGNHLWMSNWNMDTESIPTIYKINVTNGMIIDSFDVSGIIPYPTGLAWDGSSIWCMGIGRLYELDTLCSVQSSFPVTGNEGGGITYASGYIWYCIPYMNELQKINPSNGNVEGTYDFSTSLPTGFAFDGTDLWLSIGDDPYDWNDWQAIYKIDLSGKVLETYNAPSYGTGALAFDGSFLYCIGLSKSLWEHRIYKLGF